jgi:hypothetical protein
VVLSLQVFQPLLCMNFSHLHKHHILRQSHKVQQSLVLLLVGLYRPYIINNVRSVRQNKQTCNSETENTVEPSYNDIGLYDTSPITLDILWYQLTVNRSSILRYNNTRL